MLDTKRGGTGHNVKKTHFAIQIAKMKVSSAARAGWQSPQQPINETQQGSSFQSPLFWKRRRQGGCLSRVPSAGTRVLPGGAFPAPRPHQRTEHRSAVVPESKF